MNLTFVTLLFFCSGATALVYEVVWSKYLGLMLGSTVQAQTVVLASFMGGLALGNRLFGRRADRAAQPLSLYGYVELAIGCYAFFSPYLYTVADGIFIGAGRHVRDSAPLLLLLKSTLSAGFLLGPAILMGGTLPLIAAWLHRTTPDAGRASARFYSVNSLGAVVGAGMAGFVLVKELGLVSSLQVTGLFNILLGATAIGYARTTPMPAPVPESATKPDSANGPTATRPDSTLGLACLVVAITGGVSMGLEVLASRSLSLVFGASSQAFAIVLMSFILGIGLGASVMASPRWRKLSGPLTTIMLLLAASICITLLVSGMDRWAIWYGQAQSGLARTEMGYLYHQLLSAAISLVVIGIPAGMLGAVLPLWMRSIGSEGGGLGEGVGRLLTWNTIGAVAGSMTTGFFLMPLLGLREAFLVAAGSLGTVAVLVAWKHGHRTVLAGALVAMVGLIAVGATTGQQWRHTMSSGVFRMRGSENDYEGLRLRKQFVEIKYYEDAPDATVSVEQSLGGTDKGEIGLRINGKPDASSKSDLSTQLLLAHVPMAMRPGANSVFVLGLGSGITAGALLSFPDVQITVAENAGPVIKAARYFDEFNHGVVTNSRVLIRTEDARTLLKLHPDEYDVIICEPSNPWTAGIGNVFSREFYSLASTRLKPGGVMAQWFHIYEMNDGIVELVLRTFMEVFPHAEIWDANGGDIILLGSLKPWPSDAAVYEKLFTHPAVRSDLQRIGITSGAGFWARQLASQATALAAVPEGGIQSDMFPVLDHAAPKAFFLGKAAGFLTDLDERTWQSPLASVEKKAALASLETETLRGIFRPHNTINPQLRLLLRARLDNHSPEAEGNVPSPFRPAAWPAYNAETKSGSTQMAELLRAENELRSSGAAWRQSVLTIEAILNATRKSGTEAGWSPAHFASLAASVLLESGDAEGAKRLLLLGDSMEPGNKRIEYVARVMKHRNRY